MQALFNKYKTNILCISLKITTWCCKLGKPTMPNKDDCPYHIISIDIILIQGLAKLLSILMEISFLYHPETIILLVQ